jgi:hypothetical protein
VKFTWSYFISIWIEARSAMSSPFPYIGMESVGDGELPFPGAMSPSGNSIYHSWASFGFRGYNLAAITKNVSQEEFIIRLQVVLWSCKAQKQCLKVKALETTAEAEFLSDSLLSSCLRCHFPTLRQTMETRISLPQCELWKLESIILKSSHKA